VDVVVEQVEDLDVVVEQAEDLVVVVVVVQVAAAFSLVVVAVEVLDSYLNDQWIMINKQHQ
jgi:hypothetical protein